MSEKKMKITIECNPDNMGEQGNQFNFDLYIEEIEKILEENFPEFKIEIETNPLAIEGIQVEFNDYEPGMADLVKDLINEIPTEDNRFYQEE